MYLPVPPQRLVSHCDVCECGAWKRARDPDLLTSLSGGLNVPGHAAWPWATGLPALQWLRGRGGPAPPAPTLTPPSHQAQAHGRAFVRCPSAWDSPLTSFREWLTCLTPLHTSVLITSSS